MGDLVLDGDPQAPLRPITDYQTPLGDYLSAQAGSALQGIKDRWNYIEGARPDNTVIDYTPEGMPIYGNDPGQQRLDAANAQQRLTAAGLKMQPPESGMYADTLDSLIQRHQEQTARQIAIAGSPTGLRSILGFGVQAATSMLDPLNIAASFVPVIGPMKYTALLADAGSGLARFGIRAAVGAGEGAAGTALLQPLESQVAKSVGDDFSMTQALENVAFGAAFGAGLHSIGGAVHDSIFGAPTKPVVKTDVPETVPDLAPTGEAAPAAKPLVVHLETGDVPISPMGAAWINNSVSHETRIAATSTAVSQLLDGRGVTVDPVMRADPALQYAMAERQQPTDMATALQQARNDVAPQVKAELTAQAANASEPGAVTQMRDQLDQLRTQIDALGDEPAKSDIRALQQSQKLKFSEAQARAQAEHESRRADLQSQAQRLEQQIDSNRQATQAAQDLAALDRGEFPERYNDAVQQRAEQLLQGDPIQAAVRQMFDPSPDADRAAAQRFNSPENVAVADPVASRAVDAKLKEIPEAVKDGAAEGAELSMKAAEEKYRMTLDQLKQSGATERTLDSFAREIEPFDADVRDAEALGKGILGAALCGVTR
ncbi:hypothetical protein [Trinickia soli]|uniref:Uncharacterized protein n=1 Tax=Trinickia soli TaxID=380675 RepID=A0A2N7VQ08_9BURK|nr:hypothetical protein [Trinickia soli]PMS19249.1 hypothetical protein C0Z19_21705 [Trinickia soli]CAB3643959.1 hypothetical protein LMG24076_00443 [Trinickia soli]